MATTRLTPKEFLQDSFPPRIACLWSEDADDICRKNGMNFIQLIQPFLRPNQEMISSDLTNRRFYMKNFSLNISTVEASIAPSPTMARNIFHQCVASSVHGFKEGGQQLDIALKDALPLAIPATTPWFEAFRDEYLRLFPTCDYECIRDFLGCIFVISTSVIDPISKAKALIEQQVQQQANQKGKWFGPNIVKFFIVLHDLSVKSDDSRSRGESAIHYFTTTYGENSSFLLNINSQSQKDEPNPWLTTRPLNGGGDTKLVESSGEANGNAHPPTEEAPSVDGMPDHPLLARRQSGGVDERPAQLSSHGDLGLFLGVQDADKIKECLQTLITKCLIPYAERQIRILNELIISKKGIHRTLVNATKKIFGPSGPPRPAQKASSSSNLSQVVYAGEAVELQNRKAGDLSFMLQLYDQAFQFYQSARRDYSADQAWNYYAAASEMCGLAAFLSPTAGFSSANSRAFPIQYFEAAIKSYSDVNKTSPQSVRATIFATEICKALHLYSEAASFFKTPSPDDFDLLYGLFLEQAAHCYLRLAPSPSPRRFAFQMILAGFRYFKANQKELGILVYGYALKVFQGRGWIVAEDHIRLNIVRYSIILGMYEECLPHLLALLSGGQRQVAAQQVLNLKDFLACHRSVRGDVPVTDLAIPLIQMDMIRTVIGRPSSIDASTVQVVDEEWLALEEKTLDLKGHSSHIFKHQQMLFSHLTDNKTRPVTSVGGTVTVEIPMENTLGVPLLVDSIELVYDWHAKAGYVASGAPSPLSVTVQVAELRLAPSERGPLIFTLNFPQPGALSISGLSYVLSIIPHSSVEGAEILRIPARQSLTIRGARLNQSKAEKMAVTYAADHRLDISVLPPRAKLTAKWENFPRGVLSGQVVRLSLTVENEGNRPVNDLAIATSLPDVLIFFNATKKEHLMTLPIPSGSIEAGKKITLTAVFVAPSLADSYTLRTLLYYQSAPGEEGEEKVPTHHHPHHHIARMQHHFEVLPGLTMKGFLLPSVSIADQVIVNLQIGHVNQVQLQAIPFKLIEMLSVNARWRIDNLADEKAAGDASLMTNEETFLTLLAQPSTGEEDLSAFPVPAVLDSSDLNFIKAARSLAAHSTHHLQNDPHALCLRLLWKVTLTSDGKPTSVYGLRFITFPISLKKAQTEDGATMAGADKSGQTYRLTAQAVEDVADIMKRPSDDPFTASFLHLPLKSQELNSNFDVVDWKVQPSLEDVFLGKEQSVVVHLTLDLTCTTKEPSSHDGEEVAVGVSVELRTAVKSFPLGCRKQSVIMRPGNGTTSLHFQYCFTASGTYNMAEFVYVSAICPLIPELKVAKLQKPSTNQMLLRVI